MPTYNPKTIEPRWQRFWLENKTFKTPGDSDKPKLYILDMFPYPSGAGLHVGHPEGYTATDILCRYRRMRGDNVLHPMGWDAFGLPAEEHARKTGKHPRVTTQENIANFRRQIQMLGFSYDWDREVDTTDPKYFKWTQWIFLQLFDTWYDPALQKGRPIAELPIPADVRQQGESAIRRYQANFRLAYQVEAPVNWCPALGTVLANEEVQDGKSEVGGHPVVRMPLRQWMLRITAYAERLLDDLAQVDWPEPIKLMQRNWIGKSEGAEVDFRLQIADCRLEEMKDSGNLQSAICNLQSIRVFTTRPDTLFGATYMVLAPEHPLVARITTDKQRAAVQKYQEEASRKSDLERTELAKKKTGVFTGAYAINPVNEQPVPIWIADYVLISYGTGAIMAVPAHDERDFAFAKEFKLPIRAVVKPPLDWLMNTSVYRSLRHMEEERRGGAAQEPDTLNRSAADLIMKATQYWRQHNGEASKVVEPLYLDHPGAFDEVFSDEGTAVNSGEFDGLATAEFKQRITAWLEAKGQGSRKVNYKLRDWLFSRQRYWGEPFPILHELDDQGQPTGVVIPLSADELPLTLPELEDYKPSGRPEPPLGKATDWVNVTRDGKKYLRETNTMPQWAGSCWYYLRYIDPHNEATFVDPALAKKWVPVDLYVGGAEHAVLHLLYSRFWHKVLFDRGYVATAEPFQRLVNQGMILGEAQFLVTPDVFEANRDLLAKKNINGVPVEIDRQLFVLVNQDPSGKQSNLTEEQTAKRQGRVYIADSDIEVIGRADKMSKSRGNVVNPDDVVNQYGADSLRLYEMFMGPLEATKPWNMRGVEGVYRFLSRVWRLIIDDKADELTVLPAVQDVEPDRDTLRLLHQTIQKVTEDLDGLRFNTAIAAMMEFTNHLTKLTVRPRSALKTFVLLLSPFAPHLGEELWQVLGQGATLAYEPWPAFDPAVAKEDSIEVPVQINGKVRHRLTVPADCDEAQLKDIALNDDKVKAQLDGKTIKKCIIVPKKLVNIVVG